MYINSKKSFFYILIFFYCFSSVNVNSSSKDILNSEKSIFNYFSGVVSSNNNSNKEALKYFKNITNLKNYHENFRREYVFALVQEQKIPEAFVFLQKLEKKDLNFYNANLLMGINHLLLKNYEKSSFYFNSIFQNKEVYDFEKMIAQLLLQYTKVFQNQEYDYRTAFNQIPQNYKSFVIINDAFISCYLDNKDTDKKFLQLIDPNTLNYVRYNHFYINFLLSKDRKSEALKLLKENYNIFGPNILLHQTRSWLEDNKENKIIEIFNCKKPKNLISEFFYLIANLTSGSGDYRGSNFYLNLSLYLNSDFTFNKALLAENYFQLKDYNNSEKIYLKFNSKNRDFNWHAKKRIAKIKSVVENDEAAIYFLNKNFKKIKNPNNRHYLDLANFYKDFEKYQDSIKYYTKVLDSMNTNQPLYPRILHKRGMSYERLKMWKESEEDLMSSLSLEPGDPYVLNYLAYSWLERNINLDKSIEMLTEAYNQKKRDPYIIDSLGWGKYLTGNYYEAEKLLQQAVELLPLDPTVNDHYADILSKLNKNLQANYFWNYVLNLEDTEDEMKKKIKKKLILGLQNNS